MMGNTGMQRHLTTDAIIALSVDPRAIEPSTISQVIRENDLHQISNIADLEIFVDCVTIRHLLEQGEEARAELCATQIGATLAQFQPIEAEQEPDNFLGSMLTAPTQSSPALDICGCGHEGRAGESLCFICASNEAHAMATRKETTMEFYSGDYRLRHIGNDGPAWMQIQRAAKDPVRFGGPVYIEPLEEGWYRIPAGIEVVFIDSSWDGRGSNQVLQAPWEFRVLGEGNANSLSHYESRLRDGA